MFKIGDRTYTVVGAIQNPDHSVQTIVHVADGEASGRLKVHIPVAKCGNLIELLSAEDPSDGLEACTRYVEGALRSRPAPPDLELTVPPTEEVEPESGPEPPDVEDG